MFPGSVRGTETKSAAARALCATKKLLLLDEPVTGLDPLVTAEFYQLIERINKESEIAVVMVSHDIESALQYASHILHLQESARFGYYRRISNTARQAGNFWEVRWMFDTVAEMLSYPFMVRAFLVGSLVADVRRFWV